MAETATSEANIALLLGNGRYQDDWSTLPTVPEELELVAEVLRDMGYHVQTRLDLGVREFRETMRRFTREARERRASRAVVYIAGHGYTDDDLGYLVPVDAPRPSQATFRPEADLISMREIENWSLELPVQQALFLFDSCFSGSIFNSRGEEQVPLTLRVPASSPARQFISAGSADELVPARSKFAPVFVDALRERRGDLNRDGYVTGLELGVHLKQELPKYTNQTPQFGRHPDRRFAKGDFIFSLDSFPIPSFRPALASAAPTLPQRRRSCDLDDVVALHDDGFSRDEIRESCPRQVAGLSCSVYRVLGHLDRGKDRYWIHDSCSASDVSRRTVQDTASPWSSTPLPQRYTYTPAPALRQCVTSVLPFSSCPMNLNPMLPPGNSCQCIYQGGMVRIPGIVH